MTHTVCRGNNSAIDTFPASSSTEEMLAPTNCASGMRRSLAWVIRSISKMRSSSSPKKSRRTGSAPPGGKTSMSPPRTANSQGFSIASVRTYPASASHSASSRGTQRCPARATRSNRGKSAASGTICISDGKGATRIPGTFPSMSRRTTVNRSASKSRAEPPSPGELSSAGRSTGSGPTPAAKRSLSSETASSASSMCAVTKSTVRLVRCANAAATNTVLLPAAPRHEDAPPASTLLTRGSMALAATSPPNQVGDASLVEDITVERRRERR